MSKAPTDRPLAPATRLVSGGRKPFDHYGFVNPPVFHGSTVLSATTEDFLKHTGRYVYGRRGNPTSEALETALNEISGAAGTVLTPSGLAAVTTALLSVVKPGDHILMTDSVYKPTRHFCDVFLKRMGVETTYYDPLIGAGIAVLLKPNTSVVFVESPGSQTMEIQDIPAIAAEAHKVGAAVMIDNTWATPLLFRAFEHGCDFDIQAATKYIVGHSDVMIGTVSANPTWWPKLKATHGDLGLCVGPDDIYLALRGLRTMGVRLKQHQENAKIVAEWLQARPEIERVLYPALPSDPGHALWKRDFLGASGLFSMVFKPVSNAAFARMVDGLEFFGIGASWGGFESLALPFDASSYRSATTWKVDGPTLRLHIGLEDPKDLIEDLARGFERLAGR